MEDIIAKMIDLEREINHDIDTLVDLNREIMSIIIKFHDGEKRTNIPFSNDDKKLQSIFLSKL